MTLALVVGPASAWAHGGTTLAEGTAKGVTVLLQGSDAGAGAVDLATTLNGPGTGPAAKVVLYVRPAGGRSIRVRTESDASTIRHAEISTAGRGDWRDWDVSAIVTLADGKRLRVASTSENPPGPDPARPPQEKSAETTPPTTAATTPEASTPEPADQTPVEDISGQDGAAPAWALPSVGGLIAVSFIGLVIARRRRER